MVGNEDLIKLIDSFTLDTFPRSLILCGDRGCGKRTLVDYIGKRFHLPVKNITKNLSLDEITGYYLNVEPVLYMIDSTISVKDQNSILKFIEEPFKNSYVIVCCVCKQQLLSTILNRCLVWEFKSYSKDQLQSFTNEVLDDKITSVYNTPGKIKAYNPDSFGSMLSLADKIVKLIDRAGVANILTISDKINFGEETNKFNFDTLVDILLMTSKLSAINGEIDSNVFFQTRDLSNDRYIFNINRKYLFENYLFRLKLGVV